MLFSPTLETAAAADVLFILILLLFSFPFSGILFFATDASKAHQLLPAVAAENVLSKT